MSSVSEDKNWSTPFSVEMTSISKEEYDRLTAAEQERDLWRTKYEAIRSERDKNLPYSVDPQQQTCKVCGRPMKLDFHVPDTLWKMVVPEEHHNHVICLYCFDEYANQTGVEYAIDDICFAGKVILLRQTETERERDGWKDLHDEVVKIREELLGALNKRNSELEQENDSLRTQLTEANAELDLTTDLLAKQNIAAANMRKALETNFNAIRTINCSPLDCDDCLTGQATRMFSPRCSYRHAIMAGNKALSSSAGRDLLERVRYLEQGHQLLKDLLDDVYMLDPMGSGNRVLSGPPKRSLVEAIDAHLEGGGKDA